MVADGALELRLCVPFLFEHLQTDVRGNDLEFRFGENVLPLVG